MIDYQQLQLKIIVIKSQLVYKMWKKWQLQVLGYCWLQVLEYCCYDYIQQRSSPSKRKQICDILPAATCCQLNLHQSVIWTLKITHTYIKIFFPKGLVFLFRLVSKMKLGIKETRFWTEYLLLITFAFSESSVQDIIHGLPIISSWVSIFPWPSPWDVCLYFWPSP